AAARHVRAGEARRPRPPGRRHPRPRPAVGAGRRGDQHRRVPLRHLRLLGQSRARRLHRAADGVQGMTAIDLTVLPFTHQLKEEVWSKNAQLRASAAKFPGAWEKSFATSELVAMMDEAGIESALLPAHTGGSWAAPYETIAEMASAYPGRIHGMAGID